MNKAEIVRIASEVAIKVFQEQIRESIKERQDRRLRNTRLLFKNYHLLKAHCQNAVYNLSTLVERPIDILDEIDMLDKDTYIESIKRSTTRTYIIITHIDEMARIYKAFCDSSPKEEDRRRYRVFMAAFIDQNRTEDICVEENIDRSTFFRDVSETFEKLSALIFGIDGLSAMRQRCD